MAAIFLGRAGGTVAAQRGPAIGEVHAVRRAHITERQGTELFNDVARSDDPLLRWEVRGRGASFATDFDYRSQPVGICR